MTILKFIAKDVNECYHIARDEAERYQEMANRISIYRPRGSRPMTTEDELRYKMLIAKRNAASHIARLIRFGHFEEKE